MNTNDHHRTLDISDSGHLIEVPPTTPCLRGWPAPRVGLLLAGVTVTAILSVVAKFHGHPIVAGPVGSLLLVGCVVLIVLLLHVRYDHAAKAWRRGMTTRAEERWSSILAEVVARAESTNRQIAELAKINKTFLDELATRQAVERDLRERVTVLEAAAVGRAGIEAVQRLTLLPRSD